MHTVSKIIMHGLLYILTYLLQVLYIPLSHIQECRCLKKVIYRIDIKWMVAPFITFYCKIWVGFCQTLIIGGFILKPTEIRARFFQNSPQFERSACFYVTITGNFECFQYFNFEANFLKNEIFFRKTGVPFFSWRY